MKTLRYIFTHNNDEQWGPGVTSVGFEKIEPDDLSPATNALHPLSSGKRLTLPEYQLVYVTKGSGVLQSESTDSLSLSAGALCLLIPKETYLFVPDPDDMVWEYYWIGFEGSDMDEKVVNGFFSKKKPVVNIGYDTEVINLFNRALDVADKKTTQFRQLLSGIVNHILSLFYAMSHEPEKKPTNKIEDSIKLACQIMQENVESPISVIEIASKVDLGYSSFRQQFKIHTGISPFAYFQDLKIKRAIEFLSHTDMPIKEIAYKLHFKSADYFSAQFKKITGHKPSDFRSTPPHQ